MREPLFFIGIKGTGMSALALICKDLGYEVSGSDVDRHLFTEDELVRRGIKIYPFGCFTPQKGSSVVVGNAFGPDFPDVAEALSTDGLTCYRYTEFLSRLMDEYYAISVAGSHGKTSTTTLLSTMLEASDKTGYLIGDGHGFLRRDDHYFVVESCEFQRHFLDYHPRLTILTNIDLDHIDYYHDLADYISAFQSFVNQTADGIIYWQDDPYIKKLSFPVNTLSYGLGDDAQVQGIHVVRKQGHTEFDVLVQGKLLGHFSVPIIGDHMVLNTLATIAAGVFLELPYETMAKGLSHAHMASRRFQTDVQGENVYVDDYAHHPTEIKATLTLARQQYPDKKIVAVYRPDRPTRVHYFADDFVAALGLADVVVLSPFSANIDAKTNRDENVDFLKTLIPQAVEVREGIDQDIAKLASFGPAVYVFMSTKDVYNVKNELKRYQSN